MSKKEKPPLTLLDQVRREVASLKQGATPSAQLKTHLPEHGVEIDPPLTGAAKIGGTIGRVWATLWGSDRKALRLVAVDGGGRLVVRPPRWDLCETIGRTENTGVNNIPQIDMGKVVDWISIDAEATRFYAGFSMDGTGWRNYRWSSPLLRSGDEMSGRFEGFIRCRYISFNPVYSIINQPVTIVGEVFPTE